MHKLTGSATDIVQSKLSDASVELEEERERLANATGSTEDSNLGQLIMRNNNRSATMIGYTHGMFLGVDEAQTGGGGG